MNEQEIIKDAFKKNYFNHQQQLLGHYKVMELARLGRDMQRQRFKDIENRVLAQHEFYAQKDCCERMGVKLGDRITDADNSFLMSTEEYDRLLKLLLPIWVEEGLTDKRGYYIKNWETEAIDAERAFAFYIVDNVAPDEYKSKLREGIKNSYVLRDKLIEIFEKALNN